MNLNSMLSSYMKEAAPAPVLYPEVALEDIKLAGKDDFVCRDSFEMETLCQQHASLATLQAELQAFAALEDEAKTEAAYADLSKTATLIVQDEQEITAENFEVFNTAVEMGIKDFVKKMGDKISSGFKAIFKRFEYNLDRVAELQGQVQKLTGKPADTSLTLKKKGPLLAVGGNIEAKDVVVLLKAAADFAKNYDGKVAAVAKKMADGNHEERGLDLYGSEIAPFFEVKEKDGKEELTYALVKGANYHVNVKTKRNKVLITQAKISFVETDAGQTAPVADPKALAAVLEAIKGYFEQAIREYRNMDKSMRIIQSAHGKEGLLAGGTAVSYNNFVALLNVSYVFTDHANKVAEAALDYALNSVKAYKESTADEDDKDPKAAADLEGAEVEGDAEAAKKKTKAEGDDKDKEDKKKSEDEDDKDADDKDGEKKSDDEDEDKEKKEEDKK